MTSSAPHSSAIAAAPHGRAAGAAISKRQRARRSNDPLAPPDGVSRLTARGRRIADLVGAYLMACGDPADIARQSEVIAAAELQVLAEEARAAALAAPEKPELLNGAVRVQGAAERALRRLGIKPGAPKRSQTLREQLMAEER